MELKIFFLGFYFIFFLYSKCTLAIDIGSVTTVFQEEEKFISKVIFNNTNKSKFYTLSAYSIKNPKENKEVNKIERGAFLFSPYKFKLAPGERQIVKFFYNGPEDEIERYYKVFYHELPVPESKVINSVNSNAMFYMSMVVENIIVVRPRNLKFGYSLLDDSKIYNKGNTFFEISQKSDCTQEDSKAFSRYIMPGETVELHSISKNSDLVIIYKNRFIHLLESCR